VIEVPVVGIDEDSARLGVAIELNDGAAEFLADPARVDGLDGIVDFRFGRWQQIGIEVLLILAAIERVRLGAGRQAAPKQHKA
jgi:hypothetical protein